MFLVILLLVALSFAIIYWSIEYYRYFNGMWSMPTPKLLLPLIGNLLYVTSPQNAYWDLHNLVMIYGKMFRTNIGLLHAVVVTDPVALESLINNSCALNKSTIYGFFRNWLGTGVLTSNVEKWSGRRKLLTPTYHFKILEQFIDVFDKNSKILVGKLLKEVDKEKTDVYPFVTLCSLDIICESAMGTTVNAQEHSESEYVNAIKQLSGIFIRRVVNLLKQSDFLYQFTADYREENKNLKIVHGYTMSVIKSRRTELIQKVNRREQKEVEKLGYKAKIPFLDVLLQANYNGTPLTDEDIREEVDTFMFAGHDTTSSAISFCIYSIAKHPRIQAKLYAEQRAIFNTNPDRETTYQDLLNMKYLEMVIKETLRLYPSVPVFVRLVSEDFSYENYRFKKGTELAVMVYSLHRNPEIYPDPEVFNPERFTPDEQAKRHPYAYLPFSAGYRNCIGQKFAMLEKKAMLGMLIRKLIFHEALTSELQLKTGLIITSANGVNVRITNRLM